MFLLLYMAEITRGRAICPRVIAKLLGIRNPVFVGLAIIPRILVHGEMSDSVYLPARALEAKGINFEPQRKKINPTDAYLLTRLTDC